MLTDRSRQVIATRPRLSRPGFVRAGLACSSLAMAVALTSAPVRAQSFLAGSTTTFGNAVVTTATNTTTITISSPSAVIDWTPNDTAIGGSAITYQPNGTTATFTSATPFTVLNRIVPVDPTRGIAFDGIVNSLVNGSPGGTVFFYSPGGIFLSPNAQFNVGNLGLTSAAPLVDGSGNWYNANQVQFQAANPNTFVNTLAGAQINAPAEGSYVALVAPSVSHRGAITVNGQAALVSADAATITFNPNGLFDIQVTSGTSATGTTLFSDGSITGPVSSGAGDNHRIYAVAVPKNTAIFMAIASGSQLGFNVAGAANVTGNAIVLSAGRDIAAGAITGGSAGGGTGAADLSIRNATVTSNFMGQAKTNAFAFSTAGGTMSFASNVDLRGLTAAKLSADGAGSVTSVSGNVTLASTNFGFPGSTVPGVGGTAEIFATNAGAVNVTGNATLQAVGLGISTTNVGQRGGSGTGGVAIIQALTGGDVTIGGNADVNAFGVGGAGGPGGGLGGNALGGRAQIFSRDTGSSVMVTGTANVTAGGNGGAGNGAAGGTGTGGQALINAQAAAGASISIGGAATIYTIGTGGSSTGASGGLGTGGASTVAASVGNTVQFGGALDIFAVGNGGPSTGGAAGSSQGGSARLTLFSGGSITVAGNAQVFAPGLAGAGNGATATATGGLAEVTSQQNSSLSVTGFLNSLSAGSGIGDPATGNVGQGAGVAGTTLVSAFTGGSITVGSVLRARAAANATGNRNATGGTADVQAFSGGSITANELNIQVNAAGGTDTGSGSGSGTGGTGRLTVDGAGSVITIANGNSTGVNANGDLDFITAQGFGGQNNGGGSGIGGAATGGNATISVTNGATLTGPATVGSQGFVRIVPRATGGNANTGAPAGGTATGGNINITVDNATFTSADILPSAFAIGGSATVTATGAINGGNAVGGTRNITIRNGATAATSFSGGGPGAQGGNGTIAGRGGDASGGSASLLVNNATLNLTGRGLVFSQNSAGAGGTTGNVTAGSAFITVANGGTISVPDTAGFDDLFVGSNAFGAATSSAPGTAQGNVTAGTATLLLQNGTITGAGSILVQAVAFAASDQYAQGGTYRGGQANVFLQGGSISNPLLTVDANATGADIGAGIAGTAGGATGGFAQVQSTSGTTGLTNVTVNARGVGGNITGTGTGTGGAGTGGRANIGTNTGATLNVSGNVSLTANGTGGSDTGTGGSGVGGVGTGGLAELGTFMGGTLNLTGTLDGFARGFGGSTTRAGFAAGAGTGGTAQVYHDTAGAIALASSVNLNASGSGGMALVSGVAGALGSGGTARAFLYNAGTATLTIGGTLFADASGVGSAGNNANGGNGLGGNARIGADAAGKTITVSGAATLISSGFGGNSAAAQAGAGTGGFATVSSTDSIVRLQAGTSQFANGSAGANLAAGAGGVGIGGGARIETFGTSGSIAVTGNASLSAVSFGGASNAGAGGNAGQPMNTGAAIRANAGAIAVSGSAFVDASASGGSGGTVGGNAQGGFANARALGGDISIGGGLSTAATAFGGDGSQGGNAIAGTSNIDAGNGDLSANSAQADVDAFGGDGGAGGRGGDATAGGAFVVATSVATGAATVQFGSVSLSADALGGNGGTGASGGGAGGAGGNAIGGNSQLFGTAGNGVLTVSGSSVLTAQGQGGGGGTGNTVTSGAGGLGGAGGTGTGGSVLTGTFSGTDIPSLTGSASLAGLTLQASGSGGDGGSGGSGTSVGNGGAGGAALAGGATLQSRGVLTTYSTATLNADAIGGDGGTGAVAGIGGNATVGNAGGAGVIVSNRFNRLDQPGLLSGGNIAVSVAASGGIGSTPGATLVGDSPVAFIVDHATANIANLSYLVGGTAVSGALPSQISLIAATANVPGTFSLTTPGTLSLSLDTSTFNVGTLSLNVGNFVLPATRPATLGTINVSNSLALSSTLDFLAYANFGGTFNGAFAVGGSVLTGDLTLAGAVDIVAGGSITTGTISASDVALDAGQAILTAAITTSGDIDLDAGGTITTGALVAGDTIGVDAIGALNVASASAGIVNPSTATGAEYNIGLRSLMSVVAGDLSARNSAGVSSPGSIAVGNVSVGQTFLALPGTSLTTGSITTGTTGGRVYIASNSMEVLGGQVAGVFNPAPILAATPVATNGPITINGAVTTTVLQANTLQSQAITGATVARGTAVLVAGTTLNTANIIVGDRAVIAAGGNIVLGDVNAGASPALPPSGLRKIAIGSSTGNVTTGNLTAGLDLGIQAGGGISTGTLLGRQILLLAGANVNTGSISALVGAQPTGQVYIGNFSMANQTANVFLPFQNLALFNLDPVRTGGPITIGGSVQAGSLFASTAQGISLQAVTANLDASGNLGFIDIDAGGLATINGALRAGDRIDIASRDIDITATGSLDGLSIRGEIQLASNNPNGAFIGDGLTTTAGYMLSQAEYGRLKAGEIAIVGDDISGLATDLTIGTLTINSSQLYGANGVALFASGNRSTETPSGILRIAGAVTGNGFAPTNEIDLLSGTVEIEAERGSLKVSAGGSDSGSSSPSNLGGFIFVEADHIHVASEAILTKLRADPLYMGHIDELNAPATVQRPDGVLNALGFEINVGETFYVQNTGSRVVPAGFVTTFDNTDVFASGDRTGGVEIVINGQFQTSTGTVTGKAAFDQVAADPTADSEQFFGFSSTSQLNGCVFLSGVCAIGQSDPVAALSSEIKLVTNATLDESPVAPAADDSDEGDDASGDKDEDDNTSDEGSSPISPPTPLISTRALDGDVNVVEPVSGAGNPALFGSAVNETTVQGGKP